MSLTENETNIVNIPDNKESMSPKMIKNELKENEPPKVSFFRLFKYSNTTEKIMILFGVIGSIGQGLTMPLM